MIPQITRESIKDHILDSLLSTMDKDDHSKVYLRTIYSDHGGYDYSRMYKSVADILMQMSGGWIRRKFDTHLGLHYVEITDDPGPFPGKYHCPTPNCLNVLTRRYSQEDRKWKYVCHDCLYEVDE